ncbi:MAG: hypothetical protein LQ340_004025 [Diploschistes diacapsis]|nr:MAG: hypothetical protein LQ340_004025 [Diploschistes diacapsis]
MSSSESSSCESSSTQKLSDDVERTLEQGHPLLQTEQFDHNGVRLSSKCSYSNGTEDLRKFLDCALANLPTGFPEVKPLTMVSTNAWSGKPALVKIEGDLYFVHLGLRGRPPRFDRIVEPSCLQDVMEDVLNGPGIHEVLAAGILKLRMMEAVSVALAKESDPERVQEVLDSWVGFLEAAYGADRF